LKPDDPDVWRSKGIALSLLDRYDEAIASYNKAIELKQGDHLAWYVKGMALDNLGRYNEAIASYNKAIEIDKNCLPALDTKGNVLVKLKKYPEAAECFKEAKTDPLIVLVRLKEEGKEVVKIMLEDDPFFNETIQKAPPDKRECYKNIYFQSLQIISLLHITDKVERLVAHYTSRSVSQQLILENSSFRLSSVVTSNDPKEGRTLLDYLGYLDVKTYLQDETYRAFSGSFIFNHNSLNQFRLYGKEENREATGVSIVIDNRFFSSEIKGILSNPESGIAGEKKEKDEKEEIQHQPLFRCIYIDPQGKHIASVGHREEYTFYRDDDTPQAEINDYKTTYIQGVLEKVREGMKALEDAIRPEDMDKAIVSKLLINLRYLVKHVAFKEEQECRVIRIMPMPKYLLDHNIHTSENGRIYIDYLKIRDHIQKIYFGPKATGLELYQDMLWHNRLNIPCERCDSPFS
jgi:tetratricopeptide (TPR) repeat protein